MLKKICSAIVAVLQAFVSPSQVRELTGQDEKEHKP